MSSNDSSGCFTLVVGLVMIGVVGGLGSVVTGYGLEVAASAFAWAGSPVTAWVLLGIVAGGGLGAVVGLRRAGRKKQVLEWSLFACLIGLLLLVGSGYTSSYQEPIMEEMSESVRVTALNLNLRPMPNTDNTPIVTAPQGAYLELLERRTDWLLVRYAGYEGWVSAEWTSSR